MANASSERKWKSPRGADSETYLFVTTMNEVAQMKNFIVTFLKDEEGLTMVEYAIAGALVTAAAVAAFTLLGVNIGARITALANIVGAA